MKSIVTVLATAGLVLAHAVPASAANGTLTLGPTSITNPSGCYSSDMWPLSVRNQTDETAIVFSGRNCHGILVGEVEPGGQGVFEFGTSVFIP
ncbi:hypothetical protein [Nocardiopsis ansamitocini]|uniref:Secreted protein n=1 Tax=Nocardiopsis ansamitocini TaxID=1670832 RepID=A0A9W6P971_9ACTN|nr:hypothetical protein [Nocardiopsis ansamitocini]GLU49919.1 hypothetical protein Nans01_42700 [Nocardiopsis ansamitocini]